MLVFSKRALQVLNHPAAFALQTFRSFGANQGLLLAGAIAYYALLSVIPLLILLVIALSHVIDQAELLNTLERYLEWLVPSQSKSVLTDISGFLENRGTIGAVLLATMLFFSSLAFGVLEKAMSVIFAHRGMVKKRHPLVSAVLPYCLVLLLGIALLAVTSVSIALQAMADESVQLLGLGWSLRGVSGVLLYLLGLAAEVLILTALYLVMPVGRTDHTHALIGGITATALWEIMRHILVWYFMTLSKASVVYGSLTTAVVALFSMEVVATLLLLGAQVISEYERLGEE